MFCHNCGAPITPGAKFCFSCGIQHAAEVPSVTTEPVCPFCGEKLEPDSVFCESCGNNITAAVPQATTQAIPHPVTQAVPQVVPQAAPQIIPQTIPPVTAQTVPQVMTQPVTQIPPQTVSQVMPQPVTQIPPQVVPQVAPQAVQSPTPKRSAAKIVVPIVISVLSVLLVSAIGIIIWLKVSKPKDNRDRKTDTDVTESRRKDRDQTDTTETRKNRETEIFPDLTDDPVYITVLETSEIQPDGQNDSGSVKYDPSKYQTSDMSTMADFQWISYDIMNGFIPSDVERLTDVQEACGGWKAYIIDEAGGEYDYIERLCNVYIGGSAQDIELSIQWDYMYNGSEDESYSEKGSPDSDFYGTWSNGSIDATGSGGITINDFWYKDGKEYAVGKMKWPDGQSSTIFLTRP